MARILCAMSGGVDSSVAAALLTQAGHEVLGVFLRLGEGADGHDGTGSTRRGGRRSCCSVDDSRDASRVADRLGIPFYPLNYRVEFDRIIDDFVTEYNAGRTPNPCARCNQWLKFGTLFETARELGCDQVATGHYARIRRGTDAGRRRVELLRGADAGKDQSYFLFTMPRESLEMTLFPIGELHKDACRALARKLGLPVADKPDSQEICFVPGGDYRAVVEARSPGSIRPGTVLDAGGNAVGKHPGHQRFTVGQRRGLGQAFGEPHYVLAIDAGSNTLTVGPRSLLARTAFDIDEINWLSIDDPPAGTTLECEVQIRHRGAPVAACVTAGGRSSASVELMASRDAVTPGQAAVFYRGDVVLGGGWITA